MDERVRVVDLGDDLERRCPAAAGRARRAGARGPRRSRRARQLRPDRGRPAGGALDRERPVQRLDTAAQAGEAVPGGSAPPLPSSTISTRAGSSRRATPMRSGSRRRAWPRSRAPRRRRSTRPSRPAAAAARRRRPATVAGSGLRSASVRRGADAAVGEHGRIDPAGEVAQLLAAPRRRRRAPRRRSCWAALGSVANFCSAMPRLRPSATSRACAPSCRSRSIRRSSASCSSTAPRRVVSSVSTRRASGAAPVRAIRRGRRTRSPGRGAPSRARSGRARSPPRSRPGRGRSPRPRRRASDSARGGGCGGTWE